MEHPAAYFLIFIDPIDPVEEGNVLKLTREKLGMGETKNSSS